MDNRGSHYYLALYWTETLVSQLKDTTLKKSFLKLLEALRENEDKIIKSYWTHKGKYLTLAVIIILIKYCLQKL